MLNWLKRLIGLRHEYFASYVVMEGFVITKHGFSVLDRAFRIRATGEDIRSLKNEIAKGQPFSADCVLLTSLTRL